jgi:hypothetical protein
MIPSGIHMMTLSIKYAAKRIQKPAYRKPGAGPGSAGSQP